MTRSKKPDLTARRRLVARRSAASDFLIGLGGTDAAEDADMGVDIGEAQATSEIGTAKQIDIRQIIKQAQKTRVPRDLKFDDSSMPDAANFYRWCTGSEFLNAEPYLEQVLIGVRLFGEYCPNPSCSDTEWMKTENHEPQEGLAGMLSKITLLEHGVCPKCKGRRSDFFRTGKLKFYNELGVNAGQRCVTGDQLLSTGYGLRRVRDLLPDALYGENEVEGLTAALSEGPLKVNKIVRIEAGERLVCATLANGTEIKGTATHGIEGWAKSYRPLQDAAKSPVVIATNHHIGEPFPIREYAAGLVHQGALPENYSAKAIRNYAMMQTMAHAVMGTLLVHRDIPYIDGGPTLDTVFKSLTADCYRDNKMVQLPDYLLSNAAPLLHTFFRTLFPDDEIGLSVMVDTEEVAREVQALAIACGWPCMRDGHSLWLDAIAYNDFSELRETVLRLEPTFSAESWDRGSLASALADIEIDSPLYYLKRLVENDYAVFNAAVADIEPEDTWTFEVPSGQRYMIDNIICENSGKSVVVAMLSTYMTHRVLKMQKPTRVYGIGDNQILQGTFVALTQAQAKDTLWEPYFGYIVASPWFQRYHALIKRYESLYGVEVMKIRDTFVLYRHRNLIVFPAGPDKRTLRGRCLVGDTMLNTNAGFVQFEELVGKRGQQEVEGVFVDSHRGTREVSHTYSTRSKTIKAMTKNGFHIEGTPEHPMLVLTKDLRYVWRPLDRLEVGDFIVSRTKHNAPMFGNYDVRVDEATILGYLIANGNGLEISSNDQAVVARLDAAFHRETGHHISSYRNQAVASHRLSTDWQRLGVKDRLEELGYKKCRSAEKEIPIGVRMAPEHVLHEFLEAYFECDSGIDGTYHNSNAPSEIILGSASKRLVEQLHVILLHAYGILGRINSRVRYDKLDRITGEFNAPRHIWTITITGGDAQKFLNTFERAKVQKYRSRIRDVKSGYGSDRRNVPYVRKFIHDLYEGARLDDGSGKKLRQFVGADGEAFRSTGRPACVNMLRSRHEVTERTTTPEFFIYEDDWDKFMPDIERICPERAARLRKLLALEAHYEEVVSIEHGTEKKRVYDVSVPEGHAFMANGLASHNTRIFYAIDEIGWFDNDASKNKIKTGAAEVSIALERSCLTVRSAEGRLVASGNDMCYTAYGFNVSSPSDFRDKICEIVRQAETSNKILGIHAPTWKMNPNVTREMLDEEFRKNQIAAARDYGAQPPVSANPFISPGTVDDCMREVGRNEVVYNQATDRRSTGISVERTAYGVITKIKKVDRPSVLAMDAGETNNSFALSCMSLVNGIPSVDVLVEIMPSPGEPLNYTLIFDRIIVPMIKARNVKVMLADRWNSTKLLQDALALGLVNIAKKYSLKYNDMWDVKNQMQGGTFSYPRSQFVKSVIELLHDQDLTNYPACFANKPVEHFMYQLVTIQDSRNQVLKGVGLTDDLWRATALAAFGLNSPDYAPFLVNTGNKHIDRNPQRLGVIGSAKAVGVSGGSQARSGTIGNFTAVLSSRRAK